MVEFVDAGRSEKTPMSVHRKPLISYPCLSAPSQFAISYANSQRLGFTEWDEVRGGWIAYTIHIPQGWRSSITVVENRLIMPSKRGKGSKRDPSVDQAAEKAPKKPAPSPKQTPPKKTKARKKGKSTASASASEKESTTALIEKPTESTAAPSKTKSASASLSKKKPSRKSVGSRPPKSQKKASTSSSSLDEEPPSAALTSLSSKKKFVAPLFPLGAASRMRSKSGSKVSCFSFLFLLFFFFFFAVFPHSFVCGREHISLANLMMLWLILRLPLCAFLLLLFLCSLWNRVYVV
jgi:hypothetical protein